MPLEQIASGSNTALYLLTDQLGSVRALTDSKGQVVATYTYSAYGLMTATTGTASTPLRFAGQYLDAESGLYYLRARSYDPTTAQFMTRDPLVLLTKQPYVYAHDNPLNRTDPSGLAPDGSLCTGYPQSCGPLPFLTPNSCLGTGANCYPIGCYPNGLPQGPQSEFDRKTEEFFKQWVKDEYTNVIQLFYLFYFPEGEYLVPDSVPFTVPGSQHGPSQIA
jgi:RHS repeat-associated protein